MYLAKEGTLFDLADLLIYENSILHKYSSQNYIFSKKQLVRIKVNCRKYRILESKLGVLHFIII